MKVKVTMSNKEEFTFDYPVGRDSNGIMVEHAVNCIPEITEDMIKGFLEEKGVRRQDIVSIDTVTPNEK